MQAEHQRGGAQVKGTYAETAYWALSNGVVTVNGGLKEGGAEKAADTFNCDLCDRLPVPGDKIRIALDENGQLCFSTNEGVWLLATPGKPAQAGAGAAPCFDEDHSLSSEATQGGLHLYIRIHKGNIEGSQTAAKHCEDGWYSHTQVRVHNELKAGVTRP